jgi:hypothetical protein
MLKSVKLTPSLTKTALKLNEFDEFNAFRVFGQC